MSLGERVFRRGNPLWRVERPRAEAWEVFGLTFYYHWTQPQIAELLQLSDRQVRRVFVEVWLTQS